jgi:hypothetical protein
MITAIHKMLAWILLPLYNWRQSRIRYKPKHASPFFSSTENFRKKIKERKNSYTGVSGFDAGIPPFRRSRVPECRECSMRIWYTAVSGIATADSFIYCVYWFDPSVLIFSISPYIRLTFD